MLSEICCGSLTLYTCDNCGTNKPQQQSLTRIGRAMKMRTESFTRFDKIRTQNSARAESDLRTLSLYGPGQTIETVQRASIRIFDRSGLHKIGTQPFARTAQVSETRTDLLVSICVKFLRSAIAVQLFKLFCLALERIALEDLPCGY